MGEVKQPGKWLAGAAVFGVFGSLLPWLAAEPLGWLGALGVLPALLLPHYPLSPRWEHFVRALRCLWGLEAMALSLGLCARGAVDYGFPGWNATVVAVLILVTVWWGSGLNPVQLERAGKLFVWLLCINAAILFALTAPRIHLRNLTVTGWGDVWGGGKMILVMLGASAALAPTQGKGPGLTTAGVGLASVATTTGAEGAALAGMLSYPFLTLCDAALFNVRLSSLGGAMWVFSVCALLLRLLAWFPGGKWGKALACGAVLGLFLTLPWDRHIIVIFLAAGGAVAYLPLICGMIRHKFHPENYI